MTITDTPAQAIRALREIAESDDIDNALDPGRNKRVARAALAGTPDPAQAVPEAASGAEQEGWLSADTLKALRAIAEGYQVESRDDRFIVVRNPEFQPDDGSNPNLVIDVDALPAAPTAGGSDGRR